VRCGYDQGGYDECDKEGQQSQDDESTAPVNGKDGQRELARLHVKLVKPQRWVVHIHAGAVVPAVIKYHDLAGRCWM
jgi:hypothetical protein